MKQHNILMPERQIDALKGVSQNADLTVSELLRRMVDHCLRPTVLNEMIPAASGRLEIHSR